MAAISDSSLSYKSIDESPKNLLSSTVETFFKLPLLQESQKIHLNGYKKEITQLEDFNEKNFEQYLSTADKLSKVVIEIFYLWAAIQKDKGQGFDFSFFLMGSLALREICDYLDKVYKKISFEFLEKKDLAKAHETTTKIIAFSSSLKSDLLEKIADHYLKQDKPEDALNIAREDLKCYHSEKFVLTKIADYYLQQDKPEDALNIARIDFNKPYDFSFKSTLLEKIADYYLQHDKPEDALNIARKDFKGPTSNIPLAHSLNNVLTKIAYYYLQHDKPEDALNIARIDFNYPYYDFSFKSTLLEKIAYYYLQHDKPEDALNIAREDFKGPTSNIHLAHSLNNVLTKIADYYLQHDKPEDALNVAKDSRYSTSLQKALLEKIAKSKK